MGKLKDSEIEEIVKRDVGRVLIQKKKTVLDGVMPDAAFKAPSADAVTPSVGHKVFRSSSASVDRLRSEFLNQNSFIEAVPTGESIPNGDSSHTKYEDEDEIVATASPNAGTDPWDPANQPKSVVISGKTKKVIGEQG